MTVYHSSEFVIEKLEFGLGKKTNDYDAVDTMYGNGNNGMLKTKR